MNNQCMGIFVLHHMKEGLFLLLYAHGRNIMIQDVPQFFFKIFSENGFLQHLSNFWTNFILYCEPPKWI
jgi:hypothetical protein